MSTQETEILKEEKEILRTEKDILSEVRKETAGLKKAGRRSVMMTALALGVIVVGILGGAYWKYSSARISIDKAQVTAPIVDLGPSSPGVLQEVDVHAGDVIPPDTVVARVGNDSIKARLGGLVVAVKDDVGKRFNPGEPIVSMIDPGELRVVGQLEENKGLKDVQVGQQATFTVDAFGSRTFFGTVDSISPTSNDSGIVFNISDKREAKAFNVKVRFDINAYPELKNGMSAKITILK